MTTSMASLKNANISNLGNQDSTQAFIDCILLYSKNLEADAVSIELQDLFFKLSEQRNQLPANASNNLIDSFLASLVSIISINPEYKLSIRAIQVLFNYLKNGIEHVLNLFIDPKVFKRFKPNKVIIKNMNMSAYILSQNFKDQELALDFCSFLLRYHKDIDYQDFSDDQFVINKIRRAEIYRSWADIEDLANGYETIHANFEKHRTVTSNAFQEIVKLVEKVKAECIQIANNAAANVKVEPQMKEDPMMRNDLNAIKAQVSSIENKIMSNQIESTRATNFQNNIQSEMNRLNEQQLQFDNNLKLLAEGTLSLSEKDKQYQVKMEMMRKDLANMAQAIETRIDTKLTTFENGQNIVKSTIETQIEQALKRYSDQVGLVEKKMASALDDRIFENKKNTQEQLAKSLEQAKFDYETLINRLGTQVQDVIARLRQDQQTSLVNSKREFEDKIWTFKNEMDDLLKVNKISIQEDVLKFKEEMRQKLDESELRTHKQFSKLLDDTTQAIEDSINTNLISQMKELDIGLKDVTARANTMDTQLHLHIEKAQKMEDNLNDHIDLIESLNRKLDKQAQTIEENKGMIIEKLGVFEAGVINELKEATSHFSFKAYEESFRKIEMDMDTFYKELLKMREDFDFKNKELGDWKSKLGTDLLNFYKKYDTQFLEASAMSKTDKENLNNLINEMTDNISKNRQSIQLLAKEVAIFQSQYNQLKEQKDEINAEMNKNNASLNKQIQDIYVQMRKLSADVFDQVKGVKANSDIQFALERERESTRTQINKAKDDMDARLQDYYAQMRNQMAQDLAQLKNSQNGATDLLNKMRQQFEQQLAKAGANQGDPSKFNGIQADLKNLTLVVQKFIDEHLQDKLMVIRNKNKAFENKIDCLEWLSRYANFYSPENVYLMVSAFKEIYTGNDVNYRTAYIDVKHGSDAIYILINNIKNEINKMNGLSSQSVSFSKNLNGLQGVMASNETKIAFLLNLMEPLLVNDLNNEIALQSGVLEVLVTILKTQEIYKQQGAQPQLKSYIKFALRCLTSAIRTEPAVNRFYTIDGGVQKVLEILEYVEDQEIIANSCKIIRICLRDDIVYDKMAMQYPQLASLIIDKMFKWNGSMPIIQESSSAIRNYVRKPEYARTMRLESVDILVDLARDTRYEKIKPVIGQALKLMTKVQEFDARIKQKNAYDLLM